MFTPNMPPEMVAEMDRRRGQGDMSTYNNPDGIVRKRPWLNPDGTHKSNEREDEMQNEKSPLEKSLENLKKFVLSSAHAPSGTSAPHGSQTGVRSAGGHSGMPSPNASAALGAVSAPKPPKPSMGGAKPPPLPNMKSMSDEERVGDGVASMLEDMSEAKKSEPNAAAHAAREEASQREAARRFGKRERDIRAHQMTTDTSKSFAWEEASKALNSRSMHVLRPLGQYDPYQIARAGTAVPMSRIAPPELEAQMRPSPVYKSCVIHGLMHKSDAACHLCTTQKSMSCKSCGGQLVKMRGGGMSCAAGH